MSPAEQPNLTGAFRAARAATTAGMPEYLETPAAAEFVRAVFAALPARVPGTPDPQLASAVDVIRAGVLGTLSALRMPATRQHRPEPDYAAEHDRWRPSLPFFGSRDPAPPPAPERPQRPFVHLPALLDQMEAAFEAVDRILVAAAPPPPERVRLPWADDGELIALFQDLLGAEVEDDGRLALRHIARLRKDLLLAHRIESVIFDGTRENLFAFTASPAVGLAAGATVRPALVTDEGRLLRRGEVRMPARSPVIPQPAPPAPAAPGPAPGTAPGFVPAAFPEAESNAAPAAGSGPAPADGPTAAPAPVPVAEPAPPSEQELRDAESSGAPDGSAPGTGPGSAPGTEPGTSRSTEGLSHD
jgi:hypothetical protein